MSAIRQISHAEQMEALRKSFAELWLTQEITLRRIRFTARQIHFAQRAAWLVFLGQHQRMDKRV